jgi:hypothetical protein
MCERHQAFDEQEMQAIVKLYFDIGFEYECCNTPYFLYQKV